MSNPTFEGTRDPSTPVEKWLTDYRDLLTEEITGAPIELADLKDDNDAKRWWELFYKAEVAQARLDHLDDLALLCDPSFDIVKQVERLLEHLTKLDEQLTSRAIHQDDTDHTMPSVEEAKIKAKRSDTTSLRKVLTRQ